LTKIEKCPISLVKIRVVRHNKPTKGGISSEQSIEENIPKNHPETQAKNGASTGMGRDIMTLLRGFD
jgi:hypothetical protein